MEECKLLIGCLGMVAKNWHADSRRILTDFVLGGWFLMGVVAKNLATDYTDLIMGE